MNVYKLTQSIFMNICQQMRIEIEITNYNTKLGTCNKSNSMKSDNLNMYIFQRFYFCNNIYPESRGAKERLPKFLLLIEL